LPGLEAKLADRVVRHDELARNGLAIECHVDSIVAVREGFVGREPSLERSGATHCTAALFVTAPQHRLNDETANESKGRDRAQAVFR
jgi:hypothetical protein